MHIFRVIAKAAVAFYDELFQFLMMGTVSLLASLLLLPAPFALAGLYAVAQRAVRGEGVNWGIYWGGVKEYGKRAFVLMLLILLGYAIIGSNLWFYSTPEISPFPPQVGVYLLPVWAIVGLLWTGTAFYTLAFLVELEEPKTLLVLRNSFFLTVLNPLATLIWLVLTVVVIAVSIALPVLLLASPTFIITLTVTAVRTLVTSWTERAKAQAEAEEEKKRASTETDAEA